VCLIKVGTGSKWQETDSLKKKALQSLINTATACAFYFMGLTERYWLLD
jgi:hypothetical protein